MSALHTQGDPWWVGTEGGVVLALPGQRSQPGQPQPERQGSSQDEGRDRATRRPLGAAQTTYGYYWRTPLATTTYFWWGPRTWLMDEPAPVLVACTRRLGAIFHSQQAATAARNDHGTPLKVTARSCARGGSGCLLGKGPPRGRARTGQAA